MKRNYRYQENLNLFSNILFTLTSCDYNRRFIIFNINFLINNVNKDFF